MHVPGPRDVLTNTYAAAILHGIVSRFDMALPGRVRGYYLLGSYGDGTTVALSDIDLVVLLRDSFQEGEEAIAGQLIEAAAHHSPIRLDIVVSSETTWRVEDVRLKLGSVLVAGEDVRTHLPLPAPEAHARYITDWANLFLSRLHEGAPALFPLAYPNSSNEFYGYAQVRIPQWYQPGAALGTKELVATICWIATALLSLMLGAAGYVGTKGESVRRYREVGGLEWGEYVHEVYARCKGTWSYGIPQSAVEREELRTICARALPFFNHYLTVASA